MSNILVLVEGGRTEPRLFKKYLEVIKDTYPDIASTDIEIYPYCSNIYVLYNEIKKYEIAGFIATSTIDILKERLKNNPSDKELEKILKKNYSEIYLMFDLEYHDPLFDSLDKEQILNQMLNTFNNETENGLLFINYPMIEAYRHWKNKTSIIDQFKTTCIKCCESHDYKALVAKEGNCFDVDHFTIDDFNNIAKANIMKSSLLINNKYEMMDYSLFRDYMNGLLILKKEFQHIKNNEIYVLCTAMFIFLNYFGKNYYEKLLNN